MSLNSCSIVEALNLTVSCGVSSSLKTSSKIFDKSKPSSIFNLLVISSPWRAFLNFLFESLILEFWTILGPFSENIGIKKEVNIIKKLDKTVRYIVLNFSKPNLKVDFFL